LSVTGYLSCLLIQYYSGSRICQNIPNLVKEEDKLTVVQERNSSRRRNGRMCEINHCFSVNCVIETITWCEDDVTELARTSGESRHPATAECEFFFWNWE
ncbi:hypothetical protein AVEN_39848-1, partial [Araneus ventricosus]